MIFGSFFGTIIIAVISSIVAAQITPKKGHP